jgi:hypothetical protein
VAWVVETYPAEVIRHVTHSRPDEVRRRLSLSSDRKETPE